MIFVRESASCAPECTHRNVVPSFIASLMARATNCTLNSEQAGGAVRVYQVIQGFTIRDRNIIIMSFRGNGYGLRNFGKCLLGFLPLDGGV